MTGNRIMNRLSVGLVGVMLCWATMVQAAVPEQIGYQGRLTDATNVALDGAYLMVFSVWDVDTGGVAALWFEQQTVTVTEGIYNVQLGAVVPFPADLFDGPDHFLQVEIFSTGEGWEVLTPRQPLTSVPFAMHAAQADSTTDGAITATMLANQAVTTEKLEDGAVTAAKVTGGFVPDLDADKLDGLDAAAFSPSAHNHDTRYYTKYEVDSIVSGLQGEIDTLKALLLGVTRAGNDITFTGVNVHIVSGSGYTGGTVNGFGNLIVGYNESLGTGDDRSGSHNIVVGPGHNYSSFGGLVTGIYNSISGEYACVIGGRDNRASGMAASVSGGEYNTASNVSASVSGGSHNTASGELASVSGGSNNTASGSFAFVGGGGGGYATEGNQAFAPFSAVLGGYRNIAGDPALSNGSIGWHASISGGVDNTASGNYASVSGGRYNTASGQLASVSGGRYNTASGELASVSGGSNNTASGSFAFVGGGGGEVDTDGNQAFGNYSSILGGFKNIAGDPALSDSLIGQRSTVSGGLENKATGEGASVGGGWRNTASGPEASVTGGFQNDAQGGRSSVTGGQNNVAVGSDSTVSGGSTRSVSGASDWRAGSLFEND